MSGISWIRTGCKNHSTNTVGIFARRVKMKGRYSAVKTVIIQNGKYPNSAKINWMTTLKWYNIWYYVDMNTIITCNKCSNPCMEPLIECWRVKQNKTWIIFVRCMFIANPPRSNTYRPWGESAVFSEKPCEVEKIPSEETFTQVEISGSDGSDYEYRLLRYCIVLSGRNWPKLLEVLPGSIIRTMCTIVFLEQKICQ